MYKNIEHMVYINFTLLIVSDILFKSSQYQIIIIIIIICYIIFKIVVYGSARKPAHIVYVHFL